MNFDQWLSAPYDKRKKEAEPKDYSLCSTCDESIGYSEYIVEYDDDGLPYFHHEDCKEK